MNPISAVIAEQQTFDDCVAQYLPYLNRFVGNLTGRAQMVEDIVQQTILKALLHADQFRFKSSVKTWLTSIAVNEIRQAYRCASRSRTVPLIMEAHDVNRSQSIELPHNLYDAKERDVLVRNAVSQLPEMYRSVVELCELQAIPMNEAAVKLGLTLPAIKTRRHRARQKLRRLVVKLRPN